MKKQSGFTLIELVVVIVVLGILAATALPKFVDLSTDARKAVIETLEGSMRSANAMVYAKAATAGQLGSTGTVTINGTAIDTVYGFAKDSLALANVMDVNANKIDATTATGMFYKGYAISTCGVTYTPATSSAVPKYVTAVGSC